MTRTISSRCLPTQYHFPILSNMSVNLEITENKLTIPIDEFFTMAARINKKRGFLFVSRMLGKHIPVDPYKPLLASGLLALTYYENESGHSLAYLQEVRDAFLANNREKRKKAYRLLQSRPLNLEEEPIVIGFAETATALGHAVFDCFEKGYYIHTTRENANGISPEFNFKEEHSHAVDQRCYADPLILQQPHPVLLVDDEITTGKTCLNIIKELHAKYPRKQYVVLSLLDWRSEEHIEQYRFLEEELNITIKVHSLLKGTIEFEGQPLEQPIIDFQKSKPDCPEAFLNWHDVSSSFRQLSERNYLSDSGRFGINELDKAKIEESCQNASNHLNREVPAGKTLCLGTGEFMYIPMKIASYLTGEVYYHSTTRSPIQPVDEEGYAIRSGFTFPNPEEREVQHYVYNIPEGEYDRVILFFEKNVSVEDTNALTSLLVERNITTIHIVTCS
ncbi:phosphoribosyltransferase family protein [Pseudalkalibacillus hwajinpoensis]|uniref:phosphoribosyltransferase family protein n=1 Tax=Guptibacillus hwajinpoensis TaxID=208199 RepID=UPI00325AAE96